MKALEFEQQQGKIFSYIHIPFISEFIMIIVVVAMVMVVIITANHKHESNKNYCINRYNLIIPLRIFPYARCALKQSWKTLRSNDKYIGHSIESVQKLVMQNMGGRGRNLKKNCMSCSTYMPNNSNFSSTEGALKLRKNSPYSVMSRFSRNPPLQSDSWAYNNQQDTIELVSDKYKVHKVPSA